MLAPSSNPASQLKQADWFSPCGAGSDSRPTNEQIAEAISLYQNALRQTDQCVDDVMRRGGGVPVGLKIDLFDRPSKTDDRDWFEQNQQRSHRARLPFPGEADKEARDVPAGHALMILLRQVEPGTRMKAAVHVRTDLLPEGDDEASAHAPCEVAMQREAAPPDRQALDVVIQKYSVHRSQAGDV